MFGALLLVVAVAATGGEEFLSVHGEPAARMVWALDLPVSSTRELTVREYLASHASALGLQPDDALVLVRDEGDLLVFERRRAGVAVHGAEVKATLDASASRLQMIHLGPPLPRARGTWLVDAARAEGVAAAGIEGVELTETVKTWRRDGDRLAPAWRVRFSAGEPMRALVDAETGRRVWRVSERLSAGLGSVYDVSPAKGGVVMRALGGLPANATTLVGSRATGRSCDGAGVGAGCVPRAMANASFDFAFMPSFLTQSDDRFGEVNAYHATDRFSAWLTALDAGVSLPPIDIYTNVGNSDQGFFLGGGARYAIELGQGPAVDWAYEGDVIFHELGHGVVQRSAGFGFYSLGPYGLEGEGGSLNEGAADCVALALSGDPVLGEFIGAYQQDAGNLLNPYLRRMDGRFTCHGRDGNLDGGDPGRFGEIHDDGRILGSFFWALHTGTQTVGQYAAAAALVRALRSVNASAGFNELATALRQHLASRHGAPAGELVACLQCERDFPVCDSVTRRMYTNETHESRLLGNDLGAPAMANGERPSTFQYELAVPAGQAVRIDRFAVTVGALPKVYARFDQKVSWAGGNPTFDAIVDAAGDLLPAQASAGTWYLQGVVTDPGMGTRRYGMRAQVTGAAARPAPPNVTCTLGGGVGPCTCVPQCSAARCGPDGCGGLCGACDAGEGCMGGACVCQPRCAGRACGADGCGGTCGTCASGTCNAGTGACEGCVPRCTGKQCGPNGCGQACGQCTGNNEICELGTGQCVDAGELPVLDAGFDGGSGGAGGGGAEQVQGTCGCGAVPSGLVLLAAAVLMMRRHRWNRVPSARGGAGRRAA